MAGIARAGTLPVVLADNHAETFGWIAGSFDLEEPVTLVLVDAHADATAAVRSDDLREQVRRVVSVDERSRRIEGWRAEGRVQAFNWIEPLMPRPVDRVIWVKQAVMTEDARDFQQRDAVGYLDGRLEFEPRKAGGFAGRWVSVSECPTRSVWRWNRTAAAGELIPAGAAIARIFWPTPGGGAGWPRHGETRPPSGRDWIPWPNEPASQAPFHSPRKWWSAG